MVGNRASSEVQRRIIMNLLRQQGLGVYSLDYIYKNLAVSVERRKGSLDEWLRDLNAAECVKVIEGLRNLRDARM